MYILKYKVKCFHLHKMNSISLKAHFIDILNADSSINLKWEEMFAYLASWCFFGFFMNFLML